ncbi:hypothetical protein MTO96_026744 [Rhipicephalus appendiculatus]
MRDRAHRTGPPPTAPELHWHKEADRLDGPTKRGTAGSAPRMPSGETDAGALSASDAICRLSQKLGEGGAVKTLLLHAQI